jgi:serine/threonine protein kinase/tetratricopeptide (TPR) repeat protein
MKVLGPSEQTIFDAVCQMTDEQARAAYLDAACAGKPELRQRIEKLLNASVRADQFLASDPLGLEHTCPEAPGPSLPSEGPGTVIDKYKLLEKLGEGGFGVVYMAEQKQPIKRRVALKIIKVGMDTREVVARFEAERQALALMDHPNIAKVLDAGATATGRPYFVMELVRGTKITDYCDAKNLPTRARLDLFVSVCQAVQHAHQKGIIHRDLKPSNILVADNDGVAVPKIIDFGIAKATQMELSEKTVFTRFHQFIGTPAYISPEQAEVTNVDIDTRSDIYSLGVLLYELLTGKTPFDAKELLESGLDEMRRTIREKEPARPSTRLGTLAVDELTTAARRRGLEPSKLVSQLRGDLDWIVIKCLEKDRARRYETANGLAMDLQRHLDNEPVAACPPGAAYRFGKLVRRNRVALAVAGAVTGALVLGLCIALWGLFRERAARVRAAAAEKNAIVEASTSKQIAQFLQDLLEGAGPEVAKGRDATILKEILDKTAQRIDTEFANQPEVEAKLRSTLGRIYYILGEYQKAQLMYRRELFLQRALHPQGSHEVAAALDNLAMAVLEQRPTEWFGTVAPEPVSMAHGAAFAQAEALSREAVGMGEKVLGQNDHHIAGWLNHLGEILILRNNFEEAERVLLRALGVVTNSPASKEVSLVTLLIRKNLRELRDEHDNPEVFREALALDRASKGNDSIEVADDLYRLAAELKPFGNHEEVKAYAREALSIYRKLLPADHLRVAQAVVLVGQWGTNLAEAEALYNEFLPPTGPKNPTMLQARAELFAQASRWKEAATDLKNALELRPSDHLLWHSLAAVLIAQGNFEEYREHCRKSFARFGSGGFEAAYRVATDCLILPSSGVDIVELAHMVDASLQAGTNSPTWPFYACTKALAEYRLGHFAEAIGWSRSVLLRTSNRPKDDQWEDYFFMWLEPQALAPLAMAQWKLGQTNAARESLATAFYLLESFRSGDYLGDPWVEVVFDRALLGEAKELVEPPPGGDIEQGADFARQAFFQRLQGKLSEAEKSACSALAAIGTNSMTLVHLGNVLLAQQRLAEAEEIFKQTLAADRRDWPDCPAQQEDSLVGLARVLRGKNRYSEAEPLFREALRARRAFVQDYTPFPLDERLADLADCLRSLGRPAESEPLYRESLTNLLRSVEKFPSSPDTRVNDGHQRLLETRINDVADVLQKQGKRAELEQFYRQLIPPGLEKQPRNRPVVLARAHLNSRRGRWAEAVPDLMMVVQLDPTNHLRYHELASVLVACGETEKYRQLCQQIVARFKDAQDGPTANRMAKDCLILPSSGVDLQAIGKLANTQLSSKPNDPWGQSLKALAEYRLGNFSNAQDFAHRVLAGSIRDAYLDVETDMILAMAQYQLRDAEKARATLAVGLTIAEVGLPGRDSGNVGNVDWPIAHALMDEARTLINLGAQSRPAQETQPPGPMLLSCRAHFLARRGLWKDAAHDLAKVIEFEPTNHLRYQDLASALIAGHDFPPYREHCQRIVAQFRDTKDALTAHRMAKACLILPDSGVDPGVISRWVQISLAPGSGPALQQTAGLAEYRQGRFSSAREIAQKVLSQPVRGAFSAEASMTLAMAQFKLGELDEARATLSEGVTLAEVALAGLDGDLGVGWVDWPIAQALMAEAQALIKGENPKPAGSGREVLSAQQASPSSNAR